MGPSDSSDPLIFTPELIPVSTSQEPSPPDMGSLCGATTCAGAAVQGRLHRADILKPLWQEPGLAMRGASGNRRQLVSLPRTLEGGQDSALVAPGSNSGCRTIGHCFPETLHLRNGTVAVRKKKARCSHRAWHTRVTHCRRRPSPVPDLPRARCPGHSRK